MDGMIHTKDSNILHQGKANRLRASTPPDKDSVNPTPPHMGWLDLAHQSKDSRP
jgi:hypothetical protein